MNKILVSLQSGWTFQYIIVPLHLRLTIKKQHYDTDT